MRSPEEQARFDTLRREVIGRQNELGRDDLLVTLDENLFGASLDPDLPQDVIDDMSEMLLLAEPVSVFITPPGSAP